MWTGPLGRDVSPPGTRAPREVSTASRATDAHPSRSSSVVGRGASRYARAYLPYSSTWSIVWFAPVPRRRGGRSAVSRISGTRDCEASTTAGKSSAAAVPLVHATATGSRSAFASPSAKNALDARRGARASSCPDAGRAPARAGSSVSRGRRTRGARRRARARPRAPTRTRTRRRPCSRHRRSSSRPSASSAAKAASRAAVPVSTGISSRPVADPTASIGLMASGHEASASSDHCVMPADSSAMNTSTPAPITAKAPTMHARYRSRVRRSPSRTASVRLPAASSVWTSRRLLATRIASASRPSAAPLHHAAAVTDPPMHERRAAGRHEPEEQEDHQLAEAESRVRPRTAAVQERRDQARAPRSRGSAPARS